MVRTMGEGKGKLVEKICRRALLSILTTFQKVIVGIAKVVIGISTLKEFNWPNEIPKIKGPDPYVDQSTTKNPSKKL